MMLTVEIKSYEEKILAMVIKLEKKIGALVRHFKLRALGLFIISNWFNYVCFISAVHKHLSYFHKIFIIYVSHSSA